MTTSDPLTIKTKQAADLFHNLKYEESLSLYTQIIQESQKSQKLDILLSSLLNRSSLYLTLQKYDLSVKDLEKYVQKNNQQISPETYVLYLNALIKNGNMEKTAKIGEQCLQMFPYHKKLNQMRKLIKQKEITSNQQVYVEKVFQKLCQFRNLREYLKDESFLTKVERLIRNPSLGRALEKADPRIKQVADALMMAQQN